MSQAHSAQRILSKAGNILPVHHRPSDDCTPDDASSKRTILQAYMHAAHTHKRNIDPANISQTVQCLWVEGYIVGENYFGFHSGLLADPAFYKTEGECFRTCLHLPCQRFSWLKVVQSGAVRKKAHDGRGQKDNLVSWYPPSEARKGLFGRRTLI